MEGRNPVREFETNQTLWRRAEAVITEAPQNVSVLVCWFCSNGFHCRHSVSSLESRGSAAACRGEALLPPADRPTGGESVTRPSVRAARYSFLLLKLESDENFLLVSRLIERTGTGSSLHT